MARASVAAAAAELSAKDRVLAGLITRYGPLPTPRPVRADRRFETLVRSILHQQLAGKAAEAIHGRFVAAVNNSVTPTSVLSCSVDDLRGAGLSGAKAASIRDLAEKVATGDVDLSALGRLDDEAVIAQLTVVRGIGRWTAEMFLFGALARPDIWPVGDLGVRLGFAHAWGLNEVPTPEVLNDLGEPFRPHRSMVAWYCWRAADDRPRPTRVVKPKGDGR